MNHSESSSVQSDSVSENPSAMADPLELPPTPQTSSAAAAASLPKRNNFHSVIVIVLLLFAVAAVYAPKLFDDTALGVSEEDTGFAYVADLDFWRRTDREKSVRATARFDLESNMNELPLEIGSWKGQEKPDANREVQILLDPEQYVRRLYQDSESGQYIWLSIIGGRSSQPFHAPDICYDADGWQYNMGSRGFQLENGGELHGLYLDAQKELPTAEKAIDRHVVSYFYVFPDQDRTLSDGIVLFKLTSNRIETIDNSLDLHENFVQQFFTSAK